MTVSFINNIWQTLLKIKIESRSFLESQIKKQPFRTCLSLKVMVSLKTILCYWSNKISRQTRSFHYNKCFPWKGMVSIVSMVCSTRKWLPLKGTASIKKNGFHCKTKWPALKEIASTKRNSFLSEAVVQRCKTRCS